VNVAARTFQPKKEWVAGMGFGTGPVSYRDESQYA